METPGIYINAGGTRANGTPTALAATFGGQASDWSLAPTTPTTADIPTAAFSTANTPSTSGNTVNGVPVAAAPGTSPVYVNGILQPNGGGAPAPVPSVFSGNQASTGSVAAPGPTGTVAPGGANPDQSFFDSMQILDPANADNYKDQIYSYYAGQSSADIAAVQATAAAAEQKANTQLGQDVAGENADAARRGMVGGGIGTDKAVTDQQQAVADAEAAKATGLATIADNINSMVTAAYTQDQTTATNYIATKQAQVTPIINSLIAAGSTLQDLQASNPVEYNKLLQYSGGDANALQASYVMAAKPASILQSWITGTTYNQLVNNPVTGKPQVQSFDMKTQVPTNWTANKIGTTTTVMQDPSNPANTITYTVDPISGAVSIDGTGTGLALLKAQGINPGTDPLNTPSTNGTGAGTASTTVSSILGVDPTTALSTVISASGLGTIVAAMIKNEGGSPAGVVNNPGNIKYTGAAGQTDSGVKATDGGTFASYATPDAGQKAIGDIVTNFAANPNATLQSFVNTYTGQIDPTASTPANATGTNGLPIAEYGSLANVAGFDPKTNALDQDAWNYISNFMSTGSLPQTTGRSAAVIAETNKIAARAKDLYQQATGQDMPNAQVMTGNLNLIQNNNALLNNLKIQEGTISKNFGLSLDNLTANNINQAPPVINKLADYLAQASGNVPIAQYLTQTGTIQNEIGSLLAIKNASGTTVADKIAGGDLLPSDLSADQMKQILTTLMKEAGNATQTIGQTNADLYQKTDALGTDPQNPVNAPGYKPMTARGFIDNYDGTWTDSNGTAGYTVSGNILTGPNGKQYDLTQ